MNDAYSKIYNPVEAAKLRVRQAAQEKVVAEFQKKERNI